MVASSLSDAQVEAFLTGAEPVDGDSAGVAEVLNAVKAIAWTDPDVDFSGLFAAAARESRVTPIERFANEHVAPIKDWRPKVMPRVAIAGVALLVFVTMSSGLAYAADGAKPGDWMYGLDRAFEVVGVGGGGASERLIEVEALVAAGAITEGLVHASEVFDGIPASDEAKAALAAAVARLNDGTDGVDLRIAAQVGGLIQYLKMAMDTDAGVDGQYVAAMVREFGAPPIDAPGPRVDPAPPFDPLAPPVDPAPPIDTPAPPVDPGPPVKPLAPPVDPGPPVDTPGPPVDPGPPVKPPGPPVDPGPPVKPPAPGVPTS
jgi:hypothetical protein